MSDAILLDFDNLDQDKLAEALTHDAPHVRIIARAIAAGWPKGMQDWLDAESRRVGRNGSVDLFYALADLHISVMGSLIGQMLKPGGWDAVAVLYKDLIDKRLCEIAAAVKSETRR